MQKFALPLLIDQTSKILILGTIPGDQSIAKQQYYGNNGNHFWKIVFTIFGENYNSNYEEKKQLLKTHGIALWNVLASCIREGSSDSKIKNEVVNDFEKLLCDYPNIRHIFFESKTAAKFYLKYMQPNNKIIYYTLPSTSGLNAWMTLEQKIESWKELAEIATTEM